MKKKFAGNAGRKPLIDALMNQKIIAGNEKLAGEIASSGELLEVARGSIIIEQGNDDTHVYLILEGAFHVIVNGRLIARRVAGDHLGEMAAILPLQRRAATVIADEASVVVKLDEAKVEELGNRYPQIWRCLARELAHRVVQRNTLATGVSKTIRVLIMSSVAGSGIARVIGRELENEQFTMVLLTDSIFKGSSKGSSHTMEGLESILDQSDVAIAVAEPNERSRDNLIFELGFFMGRLGRHRTFLVEPRGEDINLSPQLAGMNTIAYKCSHSESLPNELAPACSKLRSAIRDLGPNR
jgi:CRP/FNR family cyclic AMP-dependent transcriptional regulator